MTGEGLGSWRHFLNNDAAFANRPVQVCIFARIDDIDATGNGATIERTGMDRSVDTARQPGRDKDTGARQVPCEFFRKPSAIGRRVAPTMPMVVRPRSSALPSTDNTGGASGIAARGYG